MSENCTPQSGKNYFCAIRKDPCPCPKQNHYKDCVKKGQFHDVKYPLKIVYKKKPLPPRVLQLRFQAHHLLCVSSINKEIVAILPDIIKETDWCINAPKNMVALPVFAHTVFWYAQTNTAFGEFMAPPFEDLSHHDWDHNCEGGYTKEVEKSLRDLVNDAEEAGHEITPDNLAGALDGLSDDFRGKLEARATRPPGGTHRAWMSGLDNPQGAWHAPFSMADDGFVTKKPYPQTAFTDRILAWMDRFRKAL